MSDNAELPPEAERILKEAERRAKPEKKDEPLPELTSEVVTRLAGLTPLQYAQQLPREVRKYKVPTKVLEKAVAAVKMEKEDYQNALPHWKVEPWPGPVDGAALLDSIKQVFRRYIVLPKDADIALALWVLHAWTMDAGDISPFMVLVSPTKRCGKTSCTS